MLSVKTLSRYKVVAFLFQTSDARLVLRAIITRYFVPTGLKIGVTQIDTRIGTAWRSQTYCLSVLGKLLSRQRADPTMYSLLHKGSRTNAGYSSWQSFRRTTQSDRECERMTLSGNDGLRRRPIQQMCHQLTLSQEVALQAVARQICRVRYRGLRAIRKTRAQAGFEWGQAHCSRRWTRGCHGVSLSQYLPDTRPYRGCDYLTTSSHVAQHRVGKGMPPTVATGWW